MNDALLRFCLKLISFGLSAGKLASNPVLGSSILIDAGVKNGLCKY